VTSYTFTTVTAAHTIAATFAITGQLPVILGTAGRFAILSDQAITNTGVATSITGDVGQSPITGGAITGLTSGQVSGNIYTVDGVGPPGNISAAGMLTTAKNDASNARADATAVGRGTATLIVGNLDTQTLYPGLYTQGVIDLAVNGTVTLDAQGDSSAVFVIRSAATIILNNNSMVSLIGRAKARNVFWVGGDVTLYGGSQMKGTIIANTFDLKAGATLDGRMLIPNGGAAVTLITNTIALPTQ
jgi:Ice-binding-like